MKFLEFVEIRFKIDRRVFEDFKFIQKGDDVWIVSKDAPENLTSINRIGLRFARGVSKNPKITTVALQIFGKFASKNVYEIDEDMLEEYLRGKDILVGNVEELQKGQVIVKFKEDILGSGLYDGSKIKNQIPKARRRF